MTKIKWFILLAISALTLAACSGNAPAETTDSSETAATSATNPLTENYNILSIDEIVDGELTVTNFANDGSATLPIHTNVPVACTVVFGTTPEFGQLSLDQDMAGGTHSDHNPLLSNLAPETEYFFRVQGIDDDGNLYLSEVMNFTTPPQDNSLTDNLASPDRGATIVGYSSAFGDAAPDAQWGVLSAFDDNPNSEWSSAGDGDEAWVEVALAERAQIEQITFQTRSMSNGTAIALAFTVTTDSGETFGPFELPDAENSFEFDTTFEAETLRFDLVETTGGNTGAIDIAVYGAFLDQ